MAERELNLPAGRGKTGTKKLDEGYTKGTCRYIHVPMYVYIHTMIHRYIMYLNCPYYVLYSVIRI